VLEPANEIGIDDFKDRSRCYDSNMKIKEDYTISWSFLSIVNSKMVIFSEAKQCYCILSITLLIHIVSLI
jgi:hypothetical protein